MKKQLITLCAMALAFVPALSADQHLDGIQTVQYKVLLSPSHQSPPLTGVDASGEATVEFNVQWTGGEIMSAVVDFHLDWRAGQAEELKAMHIHRGAPGANGPVVIDTDLGAQPASMGGRVFRAASVMGPAGIDVVKEIMANPGGFYLNVHSASNPGGLLRGALQMDNTQRLIKVQDDLTMALDLLDQLDTMVRAIGFFPPRN